MARDSPPGERDHSRLLAPWRRSPQGAGIFFDFDGTLSEIVQIPSEARPLPGVPELLRNLSWKFKVVAVVSGRSARELLEWLGPGVEIWGLHGAERTRGGEVVLSQRVAPYAPVMRRVADKAREDLADLHIHGVVLEDKGVMVGLHFRAARDVEEARAALNHIAQELASRFDLVTAAGRLAFELRPPIELSKAQVLRDRAAEAELAAAAYVGDDTVDLPAFDALDEMARSRTATLRIAVRSDEAPSELLERADIVLSGPGEVVSFFRALLS
jgi:trehalose 6-phosphate phosphatase